MSDRLALVIIKRLAAEIDEKLNGRDPASLDLEPPLKEMISDYALFITLYNAKYGEPFYANKYDLQQVARDAEIINAPIKRSPQGFFYLAYRNPEALFTWRACSP